MKSTILAFSGGIGSGKSTLSIAVAQKLGWKRASFGDYVRHIAMQLGIEGSREKLQEIGASLVENPDDFCLSILKQISWQSGQHVVVDGIRHLKIIDSLNRVTQSNIYLIFVDVEDNIREGRHKKRDGVENTNIEQIESHSTELEVKNILAARADLIVDGTRSITDIVHEIETYVNKIIT